MEIPIMSQGEITCPHCLRPFELTTAMTTVIERRLRQSLDVEAAKRRKDLDEREHNLAQKAAETERARVAIEDEVTKRVAADRNKLVEKVQKQAREEVALDLKLMRERAEADAKKLEEARLREAAVAAKERTLEERLAGIDRDVQDKLKLERAALHKKAKEEAIGELKTQLTTLEQELAQNKAKLEKFAMAELELRKKAQEIEVEKRELGLKVQRTLDEERRKIKEKAKEEAVGELKGRLSTLEQELTQSKAKLEQAQEAELDIRKKAQAVEEEKRELGLKVQRTLDEERQKIQDKAKKDADEESRLKLAEKDKLVADLQQKVVEMKRKMEQGSQQTQGEVQELDIEASLKACFPGDVFEPVAKGVSGADVLQKVIGPGGTLAGCILWEVKQTKAWSDGWVSKLKADQRMAKADLAALVSAALPREIESFGDVEGLWVSSRGCAMPLASVLRTALIEVASARRATQGQATKMEMVYGYLTGPAFRQRVEALKEAFESMMEDLTREKTLMTKQWAKRESLIESILRGTVGLYGDLQGIAGREMLTIQGLEIQGYIEGPDRKRKEKEDS